MALGAPIAAGGAVASAGVAGFMYAYGSKPEQINENGFDSSMKVGAVSSVASGVIFGSASGLVQPAMNLAKPVLDMANKLVSPIIGTIANYSGPLSGIASKAADKVAPLLGFFRRAAPAMARQGSGNMVAHCVRQKVDGKEITLHETLVSGAAGACGGLALQGTFETVSIGLWGSITDDMSYKKIEELCLNREALRMEVFLHTMISETAAGTVNAGTHQLLTNYLNGQTLTKDMKEAMVRGMMGSAINALPGAMMQERMIAHEIKYHQLRNCTGPDYERLKPILKNLAELYEFYYATDLEKNAAADISRSLKEWNDQALGAMASAIQAPTNPPNDRPALGLPAAHPIPQQAAVQPAQPAVLPIVQVQPVAPAPQEPVVLTREYRNTKLFPPKV